MTTATSQRRPRPAEFMPNDRIQLHGARLAGTDLYRILQRFWNDVVLSACGKTRNDVRADSGRERWELSRRLESQRVLPGGCKKKVCSKGLDHQGNTPREPPLKLVERPLSLLSGLNEGWGCGGVLRRAAVSSLKSAAKPLGLNLVSEYLRLLVISAAPVRSRPHRTANHALNFCAPSVSPFAHKSTTRSSRASRQLLLVLFVVASSDSPSCSLNHLDGCGRYPIL